MREELKKLIGDEYPVIYLHAVSEDGKKSITLYDSGDPTWHQITTGEKKDTAFAMRNFIYLLLGAAYSLLPDRVTIPTKTKGKR